jgi:NADH-quinone oxidoreductase subunit H
MLEQLNVFSGYNINYDFTQSFLIQDQYVSFFKVVLIILLLTVIQLVMVIVAAGISSLLERKVFASVQRRQGPAVVGFGGIYQFIADGVKLLLKEVISPYPSTYVTFILAPMLVFIVAMLGWVFIPNDFGYVFVDLELNALWSFTFSSLGVYGLILAGWSSNSKYSFLGSLRSAAQMVSYEVSLGFIIICVALVSGSYNFTKIVLAQHNIWFLFALWPLAIAFYISILAETNRAPFDLPEAEAELVAGYNLEYSAIPFALFFLGEYSSMLLMSSIFILFF